MDIDFLPIYNNLSHKIINLEKERDDYKKALQETIETIHKERCGGRIHHPSCEGPFQALEKWKVKV